MSLRIYIQQTPTYNLQNQQIHYYGTNPLNLNVALGGLPAQRQFPNYGSYLEITGDIAEDDIKLTWTEERDTDGVVVPGAFQAKKSASGELNVEGQAYQLIKQWLFDDVSAASNKVDVKIEDVGCGSYEGYQLAATDITFCGGTICTLDINLKQRDERMQCIKSTVISDNWMGWFNNTIDPSDPNAKRHPRFSYCNEQRPNGTMIMVWWMMGISNVMLLTMIPLLFALNGIFAIINVIIGVIQTIIAIVGGKDPGKVNWQTIPYFDFKAMLDGIGQYYIESGGCGREHPAPLIRDYITNVCKKCGVQVDEHTCPIFFNGSMWSPIGNKWTVSSGVKDGRNPYYNACYMHAQTERGVRRFDNLNILFGSKENDYTFYLPDNAPVLTLDMFLDQLKGVFNAEWRIRNGYLYFWRKDWFLIGQPGYLFDFTGSGADRRKILEGVCFEWNGKKYPAYVQGLYAPDAADTCGNEARKHANGLASYGSIDANPNIEGVQDKTVQFGAAKFRLDGASTDYIFDAMQVIVNGAVFSPFSPGLFRDIVYPYFDQYADYALLMKDETCTLPKILIWDGNGYMNARALKDVAAIGSNSLGLPELAPNTVYNTTGAFWAMKHPIENLVIGRKLSFGSVPPGQYVVQDYFGIDVANKPALLVNYPMFFQPDFQDNLWDYFHWIDDPRLNPKMNLNFRLKMEMCCDDLKRLEVFGDANNIQLGGVVKVPNQYFQDGTVTEITASYDAGDPLGRYIEIKGVL